METAIDKKTGEVTEPDFQTFTDAELAEYIVAEREHASLHYRLLKQAETTLFRRMEDDEATVRDAGEYTVKLIPNVSYGYDLEAIESLRPLLSRDQWDSAVSYVTKVNKTKLNLLVKLGGEVKRIIESAVTVIPGMPKLEIEKKR